jgi:hypothetical protein
MSVRRRQRIFLDCNSWSNNKTFPKAWMFDQQIQLRHQQFFFTLYLRIDLPSHHPHFTICCTHRLKPNKLNSPSILVNLVDFPLNFSGFLLFKFISFAESPNNYNRLGCCFTYKKMKVHKQTMVSGWRRWQRQRDISRNSVGRDIANFLYINPCRRLVWEKKNRNLKLGGSRSGVVATNNK